MSATACDKEFYGGPLDGESIHGDKWPVIWDAKQPEVSGVTLRGVYRYERAGNGSMWFVAELDIGYSRPS